jgi:4-hydroxy-tetrahydrodipicolinate synthase
MSLPDDPTATIRRRLEWGLVPAVPVPFRGRTLAADAQQAYAGWMAGRRVAGVAVWAHTGRGPHLSADQRRAVLDTWRAALPDRLLVAGAATLEMGRAARQGGADLLLAFPRAEDPVGWHAALSAELPVMAFYLYDAAGGVAYDEATLRAILSLPRVVGIKVATLDSVMTFQRIAALVAAHPDRLLVSGEDRFLGYSLMLGARAALVGMGSALTDLQIELLEAFRGPDLARFVQLSAAIDRFAQATFLAPMEGYVRRMLWAVAASGALPADACDDPWGPALAAVERERVTQAVQDAGAPRC